MGRADTVDEAVRGLAGREVLRRQAARGAHEVAMGPIGLTQDVVGRNVLPGVDEARVPAVEVVVDPLDVGLLAACEALERRQHLDLPAGDVGHDLPHAPRPQPHLAHLRLAEPVDRGPQLRVLLLGRLDDILPRFHRAPPGVWFTAAPHVPGAPAGGVRGTCGSAYRGAAPGRGAPAPPAPAAPSGRGGAPSPGGGPAPSPP